MLTFMHVVNTIENSEHHVKEYCFCLICLFVFDPIVNEFLNKFIVNHICVLINLYTIYIYIYIYVCVYGIPYMVFNNYINIGYEYLLVQI